jgi:hypothetical protein
MKVGRSHESYLAFLRVSCLVLSLLIVNSDNLPPTNYDTVFKSAGLDTVSYSPPSASLLASGWPTLGSLIDSGKRLVTFMDASADFTSVPYIIDGMLHGIPVGALLNTLLGTYFRIH